MRSSRPWRTWLIVGLAASALAVQQVRLAAADWFATTEPDRALHHWPDHTIAHLQVARVDLAANQAASAATHATRALARAPLRGVAHRLLAQAALVREDVAMARIQFKLASRRAPRDRMAHAWLSRDAAARGDYVLAVAETDQLLRLAPGLLDGAFPALHSFVQQPEARSALLHLLGESAPPWRGVFLTRFARVSDDRTLVAALLSPLRRAPLPLTPDEREAWIMRLLHDGQVGQAQFLWIEGLPQDQRKAVGNIYDGGFEFPPSQRGFGWQFLPIPGASMHRESGSGVNQSQALVVDFHDRRVPFAHVQQRLALPAGRFILKGRVRPDGLRNERGLLWAIRCEGGPELVRTRPFSGSQAWQTFESTFEVPQSGCVGQLLTLRLDARIAAEQWIGGRIWFDDLAIVAERS